KGPVAVAVILPTACVYALLQRRFIQILLRCSLLLGALIFLLINLPWFWMAFHRLGIEFWNGFFVSQNATRFFSVLLGHGGGPLYYVPVLLLGAFPCSAAGIPALWFAMKRNPSELWRQDVGRRLVLLSVTAVAVVVVVFSIAATKLPHYILPAFPFFALLGGYLLLEFDQTGQAENKGLRRVFWILLVVLCAGCALAALATPVVAEHYWTSLERLIRPDSSEYAFTAKPPLLGLLPFLLSAAFTIIALGACISRKLYGYKGVGLAICAGGLLACGIGVVAGVTALMPMHKPAITMAKDVEGKLGGGAEVVTYGLWKPTLFYYMNRKIKRFRFSEEDDFEDLKDLLASGRPVFVMTRKTLWSRIAEMPGSLQIASYEGYLLCGNQAAMERWR
ncbi:MAG: hypothetical protein HY801_16690, partial [Candidatus Lindowbacteria bacterium]|nr:hypothetical protein [Candidatus Lindowbacteria bacterium]